VCEVISISPFGVWLLLNKKEYFLDHRRYPWFSKARVADVLNVTSPGVGHIRWPTLDIDLEIDSLLFPKKYPLIAKNSSVAKRKAIQGRKKSTGKGSR
jgi:hypothetical protein